MNFNFSWFFRRVPKWPRSPWLEHRWPMLASCWDLAIQMWLHQTVQMIKRDLIQVIFLNDVEKLEKIILLSNIYPCKTITFYTNILTWKVVLVSLVTNHHFWSKFLCRKILSFSLYIISLYRLKSMFFYIFSNRVGPKEEVM